MTEALQTCRPVEGPLEPSVRPLSPGAQRALMQLALVNGMDPSTDGFAWCGPFGPTLVRRGLAKRDGLDAMGFRRYTATEQGKAEGLRLFRATALRPNVRGKPPKVGLGE
jgi:hypothetical protein